MNADDLANFISVIISIILYFVLFYYIFHVDKKVKKLEDEVIKLKKRLRQYE